MIELLTTLKAVCEQTVIALLALISIYMPFGGIGDTASSTPVFINYSDITAVNSDTLLNTKIDETLSAISQDKPLPPELPFKIFYSGYTMHKQGEATIENGHKINFVIKVNGKDFIKSVTQSDIPENNKIVDWHL